MKIEEAEENLNIKGDFGLTTTKAFSSYNYAKQMSTNKIFAFRKLSDNEKGYNEDIEKYIDFKNDYLMKFEKENDLIFWECCNGGSLQFFMNYFTSENWPLEEILIQKIIKQIIEGLECLHKNNNDKIIGGFSLNNIFINFKGIKKEELWNNYNLIRKQYKTYKKEEDINSFNIKMRYFVSLEEREKAIKSDYNTSENETKNYLAPEILKKPEKNENPTSANMWSLGVLTYKLLTGNNKFYDKNQKEMKINSELTPSLQIINFITSLLKYFPDERPQLEKIKNHEFLKSNPENFDFINIKLIAKGEKNIILNLEKTYPIYIFLSNTNLYKKIPICNLYESKLKDIDIKIKCNNQNIEKLKDEYNKLRNMNPKIREALKNEIENQKNINKNFFEEKEKIKNIIKNNS